MTENISIPQTCKFIIRPLNESNIRGGRVVIITFAAPEILNFPLQNYKLTLRAQRLNWYTHV